MEQLHKHSFISTEVNNGMAKTLAAEGNIVTIHANHQITPNIHIFAYRFDGTKYIKIGILLQMLKT
jgi:hypothetical protein